MPQGSWEEVVVDSWGFSRSDPPMRSGNYKQKITKFIRIKVFKMFKPKS